MATAPSLFGATPDEIRQQQAGALDAQALQYAQMDPFQRASYGIYRGANQLGGAIGGMLGGTDPQMARASKMQQIASQHDASTPGGLQGLARAFAEAGFNQEALRASQTAQAAVLQEAQVSKANAEAGVITTKAARDAQFTAGMAALPKDATDADRLALAMATGSQSDVLKAIEMSTNKEEARKLAVELAKTKAEDALQRMREQEQGKLDRMREQGANEAQMRAQANASRELIAGAMIALKQGQQTAPVLKPKLQADELDDLKSIDNFKAQRAGLEGPLASLLPNDKGVRALELGPLKNATYAAQNATGNSTASSLLYGKLKSAVDTAVNLQVSNEKGVQTDKDVLRFRDAVIAAFGRNDSKATYEALKLFSDAIGTASKATEKRIESRRSSQKVEPYDFGNSTTTPAPAAGVWGKATAQ